MDKRVDSKSIKKQKGVFDRFINYFASPSSTNSPQSPTTVKKSNVINGALSKSATTGRPSNNTSAAKTTQPPESNYQVNSRTLQPTTTKGTRSNTSRQSSTPAATSQVWQRVENEVGIAPPGYYAMQSNSAKNIDRTNGYMTFDGYGGGDEESSDSRLWHQGLSQGMDTIRHMDRIDLPPLPHICGLQDDLGSRERTSSTSNRGGHKFRVMSMGKVTWCDYCGDHIWDTVGGRSGFRCDICSMTCHFQCCQLVVLPCEPPEKMLTMRAMAAINRPSANINPRSSQVVSREAWVDRDDNSSNPHSSVIPPAVPHFAPNHPRYPAQPIHYNNNNNLVESKPSFIHYPATTGPPSNSTYIPPPPNRIPLPSYSAYYNQSSIPQHQPPPRHWKEDLDDDDEDEEDNRYYTCHANDWTLGSNTSDADYSTIASTTSSISDWNRTITLPQAPIPPPRTASLDQQLAYHQGNHKTPSNGESGYISNPVDQYDEDSEGSAGNTPWSTARGPLLQCATMEETENGDLTRGSYDSVRSSEYMPVFRFSLLQGGLVCRPESTSYGTLSSTTSSVFDTLTSTYSSRSEHKSSQSSTSLALSSLHQTYDFSTFDRDTIRQFNVQIRELAGGPDSCSLGWSVTEQRPWENSVSSMKIRVDVFNANDFGLVAQMPDANCPEIQCPIRVHMNLIRPIKMLQTARPSSIYDVVGGEGKANTNAAELTSFRLPRGTTKTQHVTMSTSAQELISSLLKRFYIKDNPHKFSLYEHTIEGDRELSVRKLSDQESPLRLVFSWTEEGVETFNKLLLVKRLVLQENETGDIDWTAFQLPELRNFLMMLKKEEDEHKRDIIQRFTLSQQEIERLLTIKKEEASVKINSKESFA